MIGHRPFKSIIVILCYCKTNSQILACLYHISENVKSRLGQFLKSKSRTSTATNRSTEEKDFDSYIFICTTCDKIRSCQNVIEANLCSEAGFNCEDEEIVIEEPEIDANVDSSTESDQDNSFCTVSTDNSEMEVFEVLYKSNFNGKISWYRLWDNVSFCFILS